MTRATIGAVVLAATLSGDAWAQQTPPPQAQDRDELRQMCGEEVRKQCSLDKVKAGFFVLPSQSAIRRCVAESLEKFSEPCRAIFAGGETDKPPRREDNRN